MGIRLDKLKLKEDLGLDSLGVGEEVSVGDVGVNVETKYLDELSVKDDVQLDELSLGDDVSIGGVDIGVEKIYVGEIEGVGIVNATINESGELVLSFSDGTDKIVGKVVGDNGQDGQDGVGIADIKIDENGSLLVKLTNSEQYQNLGKVVGENGKDGGDGKDGVGISSITLTNTEGLVDTYTITYTDGATTTFTVKNGKDGASSDEGLTKADVEAMFVGADDDGNPTAFGLAIEAIAGPIVSEEVQMVLGDVESIVESTAERIGLCTTDQAYYVAVNAIENSATIGSLGERVTALEEKEPSEDDSGGLTEDDLGPWLKQHMYYPIPSDELTNAIYMYLGMNQFVTMHNDDGAIVLSQFTANEIDASNLSCGADSEGNRQKIKDIFATKEELSNLGGMDETALQAYLDANNYATATTVEIAVDNKLSTLSSAQVYPWGDGYKLMTPSGAEVNGDMLFCGWKNGEPASIKDIYATKEELKNAGGVTFDDIDYIETNAVGANDVCYDDGRSISWCSQSEVYDEGGSTLGSFNLSQSVPLAAGDNITFEVDEDNQIVRINATGGGTADLTELEKKVQENSTNITLLTKRVGSAERRISTLEENGGGSSGGGESVVSNSPVLIEVTSVRNDWYDEEDMKHVRVNVRVISGTLQEGDELQLCNPVNKQMYHKDEDGNKINIRYKQRLCKKCSETILATDIERVNAGGTLTLKIPEGLYGKIFAYSLNAAGVIKAPRVLRIVRENSKGQKIQISNSVRVVHNHGAGTLKVF